MNQQNVFKFLGTAASLFTLPEKDPVTGKWPAELDEGAEFAFGPSYTYWADWISDTRIGQKLYIGTKGADMDNNVLWGYSYFEYTNDAAQRELNLSHATGYQVRKVIFCWGEFSYCEDKAVEFHKDSDWAVKGITYLDCLQWCDYILNKNGNICGADILYYIFYILE